MKLNKKMIIILASIVGIIVVLIIILMLFVGGGSKKLSYEKIEQKIVAAGESYFIKNEKELPSSGTKTISVDTLVKAGYLKDLSNYTDKGVSCDGKLFVTKNPIGYAYRASLECGDNYSTQTLNSVLTKNVVTSGSGLYKMEQSVSDEESENVYIFRGDNVNNYIKLGDFYWEIIKVYENGEIAVLGAPELLVTIWDDRFNIANNSYDGKNDYDVSRIKDTIESKVVQNNNGYLIIKSLITLHDACIGKRSINDESKDGSSECSVILENQYFSLLPAYDYINASLDENCNTILDKSCYNYNFLSNDDEFWTITGVEENTSDVYYVDYITDYAVANQNRGARLYAHLAPNVTYVSGSGTYDDPYIIK